MSPDCIKIEQLLWQYPDGNISPDDKALVELHLSQCNACRQAQKTIRMLKESSLATGKEAGASDPHIFDSAVMRKIEAQKRPAAVPETPSRQYIIRMAISLAAAATIVFFMARSISDLGRIAPPSQSSNISKPDSLQEYNYINIELGQNKAAGSPKDNLAAKPGGDKSSMSSDRKSDLRIEMPSGASKRSAASPEPPKPEPTPTLAQNERIESKKIEIKQPDLASSETPAPPKPNEIQTLRSGRTTAVAPMLADRDEKTQPPEVMSSAPVQEQGSYSILSKPVSQSGPDSINIEGIYLSGDNIPLNVQSSAASLSEVISDTGSVQLGAPQSSMLVTIDKMPEVIDMVKPEYPVWARKRGLSGIVWMKAKIDESGNVVGTEVLSSSAKGAGFEEASVKAARQSKFRPALINGSAHEVSIIYPVKFIFKNQ